MWVGRLYTFLIGRKFRSFGKKSIIKPFLNSSHEEYIVVGENVNIGSFCRITVSTEFGGTKCQSSNQTRIQIGDNTAIGNNTFISANNSIVIGKNVIMSSYVFITDHDHRFDDITKNIHDQPLTEGGSVFIGDNVFLGEKCSILKNVKIGERSVVASNSVVSRDVPAYTIVAGNPARAIKRYDFSSSRWVRVDDSKELNSGVH